LSRGSGAIVEKEEHAMGGGKPKPQIIKKVEERRHFEKKRESGVG